MRMLLKTPFVTGIAVLSLALGIGANSAIFSMFDQLLRRPLPVAEPARLVNLSAPGPMPGSNTCNQAGDCDEVWSYPMFRDLEKAQTPFTGIAAHRLFGASYSVRGEPLAGEGMLVSGSYFPILGITPTAGRLIGPDEDQMPGGHFVAVLSHDFWTTHFGGDPSVLGQSLIINGNPYTIIGVAPEGFRGTTPGSHPLVFVPITMREQVRQFGDFENRRSYWIYLFARLKPGMTMEQAQVAMNAIYHPILSDVEAPLQRGMSDQTMERFKAKQLLVADGRRGQSQIHREAKTPLMMLFAVTGIVLMIACANIANLLLARGANRATEMGVRLSLGATRRDLVVQLLTESVILALAGGVVSLLVAHWTLHLISSLLPPEASQSMQFSVQPSVVAFAGLLSIGTGLLFGLFPALHSTREDLITVIRAGAGQIAGGRVAARFRNALVTVQIALSMALLIASALFLKSLVNVSRVDLGLETGDVSTFSIVPTRAGYDSTRAILLYGRVEEELAAIPGVTGVTASLVPLVSGNNWGNDVLVQGYPRGPDVDANSRFNEVGAGFFQTMGIRLLAGREFTTSDQQGTHKVAVVNQAFADKFGLGKEAVGKFMGSRGDTDSLDIEIVGLVPNVAYSEVKGVVPPVFYLPWRQDGNVYGMYYYVRSALPPEQMLGTLRNTMKGIDPNLPVEDLKTLVQQVKENVFLDRLISILATTFAVLATMLAAVGLYGVLAYSVAQRTREIGIRMALGAESGQVRGLVLKQVALMLAIGGTLGVAAALGLGRAAQSLLFGLEGHDPFAFAAAVLLLAVVAFGAGVLPARRAAQVDPMHALRYD
jgi:predicted permease